LTVPLVLSTPLVASSSPPSKVMSLIRVPDWYTAASLSLGANAVVAVVQCISTIS